MLTQGRTWLQADVASQRGALQLLDALDKKGGKTPAHPAYPMPTGFLEDLATRFENEGLEDMLGPSGAAFHLIYKLLLEYPTSLIAPARLPSLLPPLLLCSVSDSDPA